MVGDPDLATSQGFFEIELKVAVSLVQIREDFRMIFDLKACGLFPRESLSC